MKRIIVSPAWFPNKDTTSAGDFIQLHAELIAKKHKVVICFAWQRSNQQKQFVLDVREENNIRIVTCYYKRSSFRILNLIKYLIAHKKTINSGISFLGSVDFFYVNVLTKPAFWSYIYSLIYKIPFFITEHSSYHIRQHPKDLLYFFRKLVQRFLISRSKGISVVSETLKDALTQKGFSNKNFKVIPNFIDSDLFGYERKVKGTDTVVRFLHISNLDNKPKNVEGIINAFQKASLIRNSIELHIIGGYQESVESLKSYIKNTGYNPKIFLYGIQDKKSIKKAYNDSDYYIMFSNYETQSIVTLEALMCGLPVIATNIPALMEFLDKENSILVHPKDEEALTEAILKCASGLASFKSREEISAKIKQRYNNELLSSKFEEFFGIA